MQAVWREIERAPASAAAIVWKKSFGNDFDTVAAALLRKTDRQASSIPCPHGCGCGHRVVPNGRAFVGVCDCEDESCDDLTLTGEDITVWEVNRSRLGRAIAWAFESKPIELHMLVPNTIQVAAFGTSAIPILLTLPRDRDEFQQVITALVAESRHRFILFAPTNRFVDSRCKELLDRQGAEFFDLASHVVLAADGKLKSSVPAEKLFARFLTPDSGQREAQKTAKDLYAFRQAGSMCDVVFNGSSTFHVSNTIGAKYLDFLLHRPNQPIKAFDLERTIRPEKENARAESSIQRISDEKTKREARQELLLLESELEEAEGLGNEEQAERLQEEIAKLRAIVGSESLLDGDSGERARDNVRKAIGKVRSKLRRGDRAEKAFEKHIGQFVSLGYDISYNQPDGINWA